MADRPDAEVVTVFAGMPMSPEKIETPYDKKCGFKNAQDAVAERQRENDAALALLQATAIDLDFPDSQYKSMNANIVYMKDVVAKLQEVVDNGGYEYIMAPLGLGHPDHIVVSEAVQQLDTDLPIWLWEDLPLRVVEPQTVTERLNKVMYHDRNLESLWQPATTHEKAAKKIRSVLCYTSQINTGILDPYVMYVPERFWKIQ